MLLLGKSLFLATHENTRVKIVTATTSPASSRPDRVG